MKDKPVILVVDDQLQNNELLEAYLIPQGYEIIKAASGEEALEKLSGNPIDLILLDVLMPGMDGFEVTRKVRQDDKIRLLPIILVTSLRETEYRVKGIEAGCDDFISKPVDKMELLARVRSLLKVKAYNDLMVNSELRYRRLFETTQDGILILNALTGEITDVNPFLINMLGYSKQELLGKKLWEIGFIKDSVASHQAFQILQEKGYVRYEDLPLETRTGKTMDVEFVSNLYTVYGHEVIQCNIRDITDRKRTEEELKVYATELEAVNKELESFSYSVSHDLRAPLRALNGFTEAVLSDYGDKMDETGRDYLNRIRKASQTMSELIDDILKLSRITRTEMHKEKVNLSKLAQSIVEELKANQPERQSQIFFVPEIWVDGDKQLLQICLDNLLRNAWKFTGKCQVAKIELGITEKNGKKVYYIHDNGVGFDMKYVEKLFEPFQRLHSNNEFPGVGVGLATVQRVINRHGGRIWAESEIGKGATFYFTLD
jgi:PAS domain S-box-containing protein